ncbi:MAG TPA: HRDC domain-containing protein [Solirubrobacteraceae bacterium]|jgi:ribonuclease D
MSGDPGAPAGGGQSQALAELFAQARAAGRLALDTEFMGEGRYRTLLCLIQLAVPHSGGSHIELVDPLSGDLDLTPIAELLSDPAIEVVVHSGRQDIALLRRHFDTEVRNIFDTQVAAGFAAMRAQSSYESLLVEILGIRVSKSASFTRWDARPLSHEQLAYAREDVVHLLQLATALGERLSAQGRLQWARQECQALERASDERDLDVVFARLPRVRKLSGDSQAIARELVDWREQTAAARDRPVQSVLADAVLVEIAKRKPSSEHQLHDIRGAGNSGIRRYSDEVLRAVRRGRERPHQPLAEDPFTTRRDPADEPLVALCEALVRLRAQQAGLAYELIATRAELQSVVAGVRSGVDAQVRTLEGWREELVGGELLRLLDGHVSLSVCGSERRVQVASVAPG